MIPLVIIRRPFVFFYILAIKRLYIFVRPINLKKKKRRKVIREKKKNEIKNRRVYF